MPDPPIVDIRNVKIVIPKHLVAQIVGILGTILLLLAVWSSFYTVEAEEVGVVLRFGKYQGTAEPGLHFRLPLGIDQIQAVPVRRQKKQEFGFRTQQAGVQTEYFSTSDFIKESLMVTGDLNAAQVEWIIQYRIDDPKAYQFNVRNAEETLRDATESVMRGVVGDRAVDEVLTIGRQAMADEAQKKLQDLVDEYQMGIRLEQVVLQDVNPPAKVKASFNEVNQAQQERERMINEAKREYNSVIPRAKGEADQKIQAAEGYATERINRAEGEATRFNAIFKEYQKAPEITRQRIFLETMTEIVPKLGKKFIIDEITQGLLPMLHFSPEEAPKL